MENRRSALLIVLFFILSISVYGDQRVIGNLNVTGGASIANTPKNSGKPDSLIIKKSDKYLGTYPTDSLLDRSKHTGIQAISTVDGLQTALNGKQSTIFGISNRLLRFNSLGGISSSIIRETDVGLVSVGEDHSWGTLQVLSPADGTAVNLHSNANNFSKIVFSRTADPSSSSTWIAGNGENTGAFLSFWVGGERLNLDVNGATVTGDVSVSGGIKEGGVLLSNKYLQSYTESDPSVPAHVKSITTTEKANWNTAYSWGNHAGLYAPSAHVGATGSAHGVATTSVNGFMSSTDKTKLDGVAANANNYVHPTTAGNKHVPTGGSTGQLLQYSGSSGTAQWWTPNFLTGNQNITLGGVVTGSGSTAISTSIADGALSIAKTSGLQTALDGKVNSSGQTTVTGPIYLNYAPYQSITLDPENNRISGGQGLHIDGLYLGANTFFEPGAPPYANYPDALACEPLVAQSYPWRGPVKMSWTDFKTALGITASDVGAQPTITGLTAGYHPYWNGSSFVNGPVQTDGTNITSAVKILSGASPQFTIQNAPDRTNWELRAGSSNDFVIRQDGTTVLRFETNGDVRTFYNMGVNTAPISGQALTVGGSGNTYAGINTSGSTALSGLRLQHLGVDRWLIGNRSADNHRLYVSASPATTSGGDVATAAAMHIDQDKSIKTYGIAGINTNPVSGIALAVNAPTVAGGEAVAGFFRQTSSDAGASVSLFLSPTGSSSRAAKILATGNGSAAGNGTSISLFTNPNGGAPIERFKIDPTGEAAFNTAPVSGQTLTVGGNATVTGDLTVSSGKRVQTEEIGVNSSVAFVKSVYSNPIGIGSTFEIQHGKSTANNVYHTFWTRAGAGTTFEELAMTITGGQVTPEKLSVGSGGTVMTKIYKLTGNLNQYGMAVINLGSGKGLKSCVMSAKVKSTAGRYLSLGPAVYTDIYNNDLTLYTSAFGGQTFDATSTYEIWVLES